MRLGVRAKLVLLSLALIAGAIVIAYVYLSSALERMLLDRIQSDLEVRLGLIEQRVSSARLELTPSAEWDALSQDLAARANARVTLVRLDGVVITDSAAHGELENHASRPEIVDALEQGRGSSTRYSSTVGLRMMYAAVPIVRDGEIRGVARLAVPLTEVEAALARLERAITVASVLALLFATLTTLVAAQLASQGFRRLTLAARRMASGDLDARSGVSGSDEFGELGRSLDHLADTLSKSLRQIVTERDLLSGVLSGMREGVLLLDRDDRVVLVNPALCAMLHVEATVQGGDVSEVLGELELGDMFDRARRDGRATVEVSVKGDKPRRLLVRAESLAGGPGGTLIVIYDVTDLRRLETLRKDFVANASHELRTPVTSIRSAAETIQHGAVEDRKALGQFVAIIDRNAERLQRLVDDLLDLSKIESREVRLDASLLPLAPIVEHVTSLFAERATRANMTLVVDVADDLPEALCDARALEQVLTNLLDNALKYCPEGATVTVRGAAAGDRVRLSVEDTGPGIGEVHLSRLFERFYRVDAGRSRALGGTGLGLAIVKHLVEAMGGEVSVDSTPGRGSRFYVALPTRTAPESHDTPPPSSDLDAGGDVSYVTEH